MPEEYDDLQTDAEQNPHKLWIQKPKAQALGEGIELVRDPADVPTDDDWMVQEYIANPLLLPDEPCKHTLRIYVALTSLDPLEVYIYSSGLAKFTSRPYTADHASLLDRVIHLTNPTVQLLNKDVGKPKPPPTEAKRKARRKVPKVERRKRPPTEARKKVPRR